MNKPLKLSTLLFAGWFALSIGVTDVSAEEEAEETDADAEEETEDDAEEDSDEAEDEAAEEERLFDVPSEEDRLLFLPRLIPDRFTYDSGIEIEYPQDGVRGVYSTAYSAGGDRFETLVDLLDRTELNSMVIDIKDDHGNITIDTDSEDERIQNNSQAIISDVDGMMETLEDSEIYPIARVVVFKDRVLGESEPQLSYTEPDGSMWENYGDVFVSAFSEEVWEYNVEVAREAAKAGFKEIQFDYIRFPENLASNEDRLNFDYGKYGDMDVESSEKRFQAVTDFVEYAREELREYGVKVSVDIFGEPVCLPDGAPTIGQDYQRIAEHVDIISAMPYPSHWGVGHIEGIPIPDLEPYNVMDWFSQLENDVLGELDNPPVSRPWLQDFTASYLGSGNYMNYGVDEVEAQIQALYDNDIYEFLLWNAGNSYTEGVDYTLGRDIEIAGADEKAEREDEEVDEEDSDEDSDDEDEDEE